MYEERPVLDRPELPRGDERALGGPKLKPSVVVAKDEVEPAGDN